MFDIQIKKSKGFNRGLNTAMRVNRINSNLMEVGAEMAKEANRLAPLQDGDLRGSMTTKKGKMVHITYWRTDYARFRYYINDKNPHTKEWAKKTSMKYAGKNLRKMGRVAL